MTDDDSADLQGDWRELRREAEAARRLAPQRARQLYRAAAAACRSDGTPLDYAHTVNTHPC